MSKFILSVLLVAFALLNAAEAQRVAFGFGTNAVGEQGRAVSSPTKIEQIPALEGKNISMITTGNMFTLVHTNMPYATYAFGRNVEGQLGLGNNANTATPTPIPALNGVQVLSMAAGSNFAVVITAGNNVYSMGDNSFGQLGLNDTTARNTPTLIPYFNQTAVKANMVNSVSCGTSHCHIYTSTNDTVAPYGMGKNDVGQLLLGNRNSSLVPRQLSLTGVAQVSCGADYTLARNTQGLVFCGGSNAMGQCGKKQH